MKKVLSIVVIVALVIVFVVSAFMVGKYFADSKKQADEFDKLAGMVTKPTEAADPGISDPESGEAASSQETIKIMGPNDMNELGIIPEYYEVYRLNGDMAGWIRIENTKVNYPVMHTPDNPNYYLKRNFNGEASEWGSIYIREECDINKPSDNITIYGHNMNDGSMFGALRQYDSKKFYEDHKLIYFDTLKEYHVYEIFSVFKTSANENEGFRYHQMVDAANEQEFNEFVSTCKKLAFYDTGITPKYGDKLICLSTCEYTLDNGRLVVAARRIY